MKKQQGAKKKMPCLYKQKSMKALYETGAILCSSEKGGTDYGISETERAIQTLKSKFEQKLLKFTEKRSKNGGISPTKTCIESPIPQTRKNEIQTIPENTQERSTSPTNADTDRKKVQSEYHTPKQSNKNSIPFTRSSTLQQLSGGSYCTPVGSSDKMKAKIVCKQLRHLMENTEMQSEKKIYDSLVKTTKFPDQEPEVPDFEEHAITSKVKQEMDKVRLHFKNGRRYLRSMSTSSTQQ